MKRIISILFVLAIVGSVVACSSPFSPKGMAGTYVNEYTNIASDYKEIETFILEDDETFTFKYEETVISTEEVSNTDASSGIYEIDSKAKEIAFTFDDGEYMKCKIADDAKSFEAILEGRTYKYTKQ